MRPEAAFTSSEAPRALARLGLRPGPRGAFATWTELEESFREYGRTLHLALDPEGPGRARLSVFLNSRLASPVAYFGLVELPAAGAAEALASLLEPARAWCLEQDVRTLRGPIAYSTWYPNRCVLTETTPVPFPGDSPYPSTLVTPFEQAGFELATEYFSAITGPLAGFVARIDPVRRHAEGRGISFAILEGSAIPGVFEEAHQLSQQAFAVNHSFTPIGREEFTRLFAAAPLLPGATVVTARAENGELLGFVFGYEAPGFDPLARVAVLKSIASDPKAAEAFCGAALSATLHRHFLERGYGRVIHALMAKDRHALGTRSPLVETIRTYGMFEKDLLR